MDSKVTTPTGATYMPSEADFVKVRHTESVSIKIPPGSCYGLETDTVDIHVPSVGMMINMVRHIHTRRGLPMPEWLHSAVVQEGTAEYDGQIRGRAMTDPFTEEGYITLTFDRWVDCDGKEKK